MSADHSVTSWIHGLKGGDEDAAAQIWERFFHRVCSLAARRLGNIAGGVQGPEDVALSAMHALYRGAKEERFRQLRDRGDLWDIVAMITIHKSIDARRRHHTREDALGGEQALVDLVADPVSLEGMVSDGYIDTLCLTGQELIEGLDEKLKPVALLRLEGYSNVEIAGRIERALPTVERYLKMIRAAWAKADPAA